MFSLDYSKYRLVDLSRAIDPDKQPKGRPFRITRGFLADNSFKHDIETHSHVGTHMESPAHFFEGGRDLMQFDLATFMGPGVLFEVDLPAGRDTYFSAEMLEKDVGGIVKPGSMMLVRNNNRATIEAGKEDCHVLPKFSKGGCQWIRDRGVRILGVDERTVWFGTSVEEIRQFHDILMSKDICVIETLDNLETLRRKEFYLLALPVKIRGLDSAWVRVAAIEEL